MKSLYLLPLFLILSGCGNFAKTTETVVPALTPEQKLKNSETDLSKAGISFDEFNAVKNCESISKKVCQNKIVFLQDYLDKIFEMYGNEEAMPRSYQLRAKSVSACMDMLVKDLANEQADHCQK